MPIPDSSQDSFDKELISLAHDECLSSRGKHLVKSGTPAFLEAGSIDIH